MVISKKGLHLKSVYDLLIFFPNHGYFALKSQNIKPKKAKKPNKNFDASRASLCSTPVYLLQHTSVPQHSGWEPLVQTVS